MIEDLKSQKDMAMRCKRLFDCQDGQEILEHLKFRFFVHTTTLFQGADGKPDQFGTAFNEGARFVILYILGLYNQDIDKLDELIKATEAGPKYKADELGV